MASTDRGDGPGDPFHPRRFAGRDRAGHRRLDGDVGLTGAMQGHDGVTSYSWLGDLGVACARRGWADVAVPGCGVETAMPIAQAEVPEPSCRFRYSKDHEYITVEDGIGTVVRTEHGQEKLSDVTLVELPRVGEQVKKGSAVGVVESVKAAYDLYSPVSGEIPAVNEALNGKPELVNEDAEGAG